MIGCLWPRVRKQPIIALYFEFEIELKYITSGPWPQYILFCIVCIVLNYILSVSFEMWDNKKEKKNNKKVEKVDFLKTIYEFS